MTSKEIRNRYDYMFDGLRSSTPATDELEASGKSGSRRCSTCCRDHAGAAQDRPEGAQAGDRRLSGKIWKLTATMAGHFGRRRPQDRQAGFATRGPRVHPGCRATSCGCSSARSVTTSQACQRLIQQPTTTSRFTRQLSLTPEKVSPWSPVANRVTHVQKSVPEPAPEQGESSDTLGRAGAPAPTTTGVRCTWSARPPAPSSTQRRGWAR